MKTKSQKPSGNIWLGAAIGCALLLIASPQTASAQTWNGPDGSNNISNANSGNVGVGLTVPFYKFDVMSGTGIIARFDSSASAHSQVLFNASSGYNTSLTFQNGGVSKWLLGNQAANNRFSFVESTGVEVFSILQNGKVGIGTTTPSQLLNVALSQDASTVLQIDNVNAGTSASARLNISNDGTIYFGTLMAGGTGYTVIPYYQDSLILNSGSTASGGLKLRAATGGIGFSTDGGQTTSNVFINSSGNLGIGTTTPAFKTSIASDATGADPIILELRGATNSNPACWQLPPMRTAR